MPARCWDACAWWCESRVAAVGVFSAMPSSSVNAGESLGRISDERFDGGADRPSESSSSSSSEPSALMPSFASRAAFTDCCAAVLFDLRMYSCRYSASADVDGRIPQSLNCIS
jgi:hypothetical protein